MRVCEVELTGRDGEAHVVTVEASSVFDAADKAVAQSSTQYWFDPQRIITVRSDRESWQVDPVPVAAMIREAQAMGEVVDFHRGDP